jgi:O-succinylbenzoic acid--CoA ligase
VDDLGDMVAGDLVSVAQAPGPSWLDVLSAAWNAGAAVLPVDSRLPRAAAGDLVARARPTASFGPDGFRRLTGGEPVDPAIRLVMATSGTAGAPKLVELTEAAITAALTASSARLGSGAEDPWHCCLPLAHMGGMLVALRHVVLGVPVSVAARFETETFADAAASGARFASLVPTALGRIARADVGTRERTRVMRAVLVGGASLDQATRDLFVERTGVAVVHSYGLTETCGGLVYDGAALDGVEIRIESATDQILLRGPSLMRGFRLDPAATAAAFDPEGRLRTGDAGSFAGGILRVDGRIDDAIVTGGEKVWPDAVEAAVRTHPGVGDVMVAGRPDPEWGERVVAFVVPADAASPLALEAVRTHAAEILPRYALPKNLVIVPELPRTASGKLRRRGPSGRAR